MIIIFLLVVILAPICYIIDKLVPVKNVLSLVQRPKQLQHIVIEPGLPAVPSNVSYIPPTQSETADKPANVYVLFSGNPGADAFYVDYLQEVHKKTQGKAHLYAIGHIYHHPLMNVDVYERFIQLSMAEAKAAGKTVAAEEIEMPRFDSQNLPKLPEGWEKKLKTADEVGKYIFRPYEEAAHEPFGLQSTIAQKVAFLAKLRQLHPKSKFIIAGHSMGSYCWLEVVRSIERCYIYKHFGEAGLILWDSEHAKLTVADVENENTPIAIPTERPDAVCKLEEKVSSILLPPEQLAQWIDSILLDTTPPSQFDAMGVPDEDDQYNKLLFNHMSTQVSQHACSFILQLHGLMPTIVRIANTPNGHDMTPWFFRPNILNFVIKIVANLPGFIKRALSNFPAPCWKYPDVNTAVRLLLNFNGIRGVVKLATEEMMMIRSLDLNLVQRNADKIFLYMSDADDWAPKYQREYFQAVSRHWMSKGLNTWKVQVDTEGAKHAFCFGTNEVVARHSLSYALERHPSFI